MCLIIYENLQSSSKKYKLYIMFIMNTFYKSIINKSKIKMETLIRVNKLHVNILGMDRLIR
jgi:hypothetical protein